MRDNVIGIGGFFMVIGAVILVIGLLWANMSTASFTGHLDRSGLYSGLGLVGVGLVVGVIGMYMLLREYKNSTKVYESVEIGGLCRECNEGYPVGAKFCAGCGESIKNEMKQEVD